MEKLNLETYKNIIDTLVNEGIIELWETEDSIKIVQTGTEIAEVKKIKTLTKKELKLAFKQAVLLAKEEFDKCGRISENDLFEVVIPKKFFEITKLELDVLFSKSFDVKKERCFYHYQVIDNNKIIPLWEIDYYDTYDNIENVINESINSLINCLNI